MLLDDLEGTIVVPPIMILATGALFYLATQAFVIGNSILSAVMFMLAFLWLILSLKESWELAQSRRSSRRG